MSLWSGRTLSIITFGRACSKTVKTDRGFGADFPESGFVVERSANPLPGIAGSQLMGIGLVAANIPINAVGALLTAGGWYDRLWHRRSSLR